VETTLLFADGNPNKLLATYLGRMKAAYRQWRNNVWCRALDTAAVIKI